MDSIQLLALTSWAERTGEGLIVVDPAGKIHLLNPRLRELLRLERIPTHVSELLAQVELILPQMRAVLSISQHAERVRWGSLQIEQHPPLRLVWEQVPLLEDDELLATVTVFREPATQGQLDVARRSFLSMISHDLRTPLSTILGFAELLYNNLASLTTEEQAEFLEHILKNANDLRNYTQIALDIMFLESDLQDFDIEPVALNRFVSHWLDDALHRFPVQRLEYHEPAYELSADIAPAALHRILYILAEFALQESPEDELIELQLGKTASEATIMLRHRAPELQAEDASQLLQLMPSRDLSEAGRPKLHRMQMYVANLLAERQRGCLTLQGDANYQYEINLTLPLTILSS